MVATFGVFFSLIFAFFSMGIFISDWRVMIADITDPANWNIRGLGEWVLFGIVALSLGGAFYKVLKHSDQILDWMDKLTKRAPRSKRREPK